MPAPLGRTAELAALRGLAERTASGHGGMLLLLGEAGIGKTRLLDETETLARANAVPVRRGRAIPGGGTYRPLAEAVRDLRHPPADPALRPYLPALGRLRPDWAPPRPSEAEVDPAVVLGEGLLHLLRPTGALLLLDDLHWADPDTLDVLGYLAGVLGNERVGIVATARDEERTKADLRHLATRRELTVCRLDRLTPADVIALAQERAGAPLPAPIRDALLAGADGLPLFVEELTDALTHGPAGLVTTAPRASAEPTQQTRTPPPADGPPGSTHPGPPRAGQEHDAHRAPDPAAASGPLGLAGHGTENAGTSVGLAGEVGDPDVSAGSVVGGVAGASVSAGVVAGGIADASVGVVAGGAAAASASAGSVVGGAAAASASAGSVVGGIADANASAGVVAGGVADANALAGGTADANASAGGAAAASASAGVVAGGAADADASAGVTDAGGGRSGVGLPPPDSVADPVAGRGAAGVAGVVPPTLATLVAGRLADLPDAQRRIVEAAAVVSGEPDAPLLAALTGVPDAEVLAALRAAHPGLLVAAGGRSRWRHALTRDAVLATVIPAEQADLARRAAALLLARGGTGDDFRAADLLALAGDAAPLGDLLLAIAGREAGRGALRAAAVLLDRAAATGARRAEVAAAATRVRTASGRPDAALDRGMPELAQARGDAHADLCLALAEAAVAAGRWVDADTLLTRAGRPGDAWVLTLRAEAAYGAGDRVGSATLAERAVLVAAAQAESPAQAGAALVVDGGHAGAVWVEDNGAGTPETENGIPAREGGPGTAEAEGGIPVREGGPGIAEAEGGIPVREGGPGTAEAEGGSRGEAGRGEGGLRAGAGRGGEGGAVTTEGGSRAGAAREGGEAQAERDGGQGARRSERGDRLRVARVEADGLAAAGPGRLVGAGAGAGAGGAAVVRRDRVAFVASAAEVWCQALIARGRSRVARDPAAARVDFARAAQLAAERAGPRVHVAALVATATVDLYDHADTIALDLAREVAVATGQLGQVAAVDLFRVEAAATVRGPQAAAGPARELIAITSRLRLFHLQALAEVLLAADRAVVADDAGMAALLDAAVARPAAAVEVFALADLVRALRALADGDLDAAIARLDVAAERLGAHGTAAPLPVWGLWAVLRTVRRDRDVAARETVRALPAGQRAANRGGLFFADAIAAGRSGDRVAAAALLAEGDWRLAEHPWWGRLLRLFTMLAAVDGGWVDPVPRLRTDLGHFGATPFARICRDLLRRAGAPTRRGRGDSAVPDALRALGVTSREMDVLQLLGSGLTNVEIAARLHLSPRTVDTHVAALLAKTGVTGRAELRQFLTR